MKYEIAKEIQIEQFKKGNYLVLREESPGDYLLVPTTSRQVAEQSIVKDAIAVVKRLPTRLRVVPGGKSDAT